MIVIRAYVTASIGGRSSEVQGGIGGLVNGLLVIREEGTKKREGQKSAEHRVKRRIFHHGGTEALEAESRLPARSRHTSGHGRR